MVGTVVGGYGAAQLKARPAHYPPEWPSSAIECWRSGPWANPQGVVARTGFRLMDP